MLQHHERVKALRNLQGRFVLLRIEPKLRLAGAQAVLHGERAPRNHVSVDGKFLFFCCRYAPHLSQFSFLLNCKEEFKKRS